MRTKWIVLTLAEAQPQALRGGRATLVFKAWFATARPPSLADVNQRTSASFSSPLPGVSSSDRSTSVHRLTRSMTYSMFGHIVVSTFGVRGNATRSGPCQICRSPPPLSGTNYRPLFRLDCAIQ